MMIFGKQRIKSHMTLEYSFSGIRILNGALIPVDWQIKIDIAALDKKGKDKDDVEFDASITFQRIFFWLETNLPNIVMVNVSNAEDLFIANLSSNIMMYCPDAPHDDLLAQLIHSKVSVLAGDDLLIGNIVINGSDVSVSYTFDPSDTGYTIPITTADYYKEGKVRDETPWWIRDDGFSFEFVRPIDETITDEEFFKDIVDPMIEFDKIIKEASDKVGNMGEPARIVQVDKWKPKKI